MKPKPTYTLKGTWQLKCLSCEKITRHFQERIGKLKCKKCGNIRGETFQNRAAWGI